MKTKHTEGPWIAEKIEDCSGIVIIRAPNMTNSSQTDNQLACMDVRTYCHVGEERMLADAKLMAAAKDLLYACQQSLETIAKIGDGKKGGVYKMVEAAIQKASPASR